MDTDIAPALYEKISDEISKKIKNSTDIQRIYRLIDEGKADYKAVNELAEKLGEIYSAALKNNLTAGVLPDGKLYYNIAERTVRPVLESCYGKSAEASVAVQQLLNNAERIGIKAIQPQPDNERLSGIIDKLSDAENIADVSWVLDEPVINFAQSAVTDTIKANAEFQSKSGLSPKIVRTVTGKCCKWCEALAGTYTYPGEVPEDVYRRHERCRCIVEYLPGNGMKQNVHTKKWVDPNEQENIEKQKNIGLKNKRPELMTQSQVLEKAKIIGDEIENSPEIFNNAKIFEKVQKQMGNDGLPKVVTEKEFNVFAKDKTVIYRGYSSDSSKSKSASQMVEEFKRGKLYSENSGGAAYGRGTYFSADEGVANSYAYGDGKVITAVLKDNARVADYRDIMREYEKAGVHKTDWEKRTSAQHIIDDVGSYAALKGYDAIALNGFQGHEHLIILNRTQLIIKE